MQGVAATLLASSVGCTQMASLGPESAAFQSGLAAWDTHYLGHVYAASLRDINHECFLALFDLSSIAEAVYGQVDATTKDEASNLVRGVFLQQRRQLGGAYPGVIRFETGNENARVVLPPVHRAFSEPVIGCPTREIPDRTDFVRRGDATGTLLIDFPARDRIVEMRVHIAEGGSSIVSIPVMREIGAPSPTPGGPRLVPQ